MADYEVTKTAGVCSVSGRVFSEGDEFYTVLRETAQGYERQDIAPEFWKGPPEEMWRIDEAYWRSLWYRPAK